MKQEPLKKLVDKFRKRKIAVVGDVMLDHFIWGESTRMSPEAPVPVVLISRETRMPGGAGNVAVNIASLGGEVFIAGFLGKDQAGDFLLKDLKKRGVHTEGLVSSAEHPTTQKSRVLSANQQVVRIDREKKTPIDPKTEKRIIGFIADNIAGWDGIVVSDYAKGCITPTLAKVMINLARKKKKFIVCDIKPANTVYFKNATLITPNRHEALAMAGTNDLKKAGRILQDKLKCHVLITQGKEGMTLFTGNRAEYFPAQAEEVFDITGAGDTVIAIVALALAAGASLKDAAFLANCGAGVVVGKAGTSALTPQELKQRLHDGE